MNRILGMSVAALTLAVTPAFAETASSTIDQAWPASPGTVILQDTIALGPVFSVQSISIEISHTFANDLDILLFAPNGDFFDLMFGEIDQTGSGDFDMGLVGGDGSLANVATYTFVETGGLTEWNDTSGVAPGGTYDANSWVTNGWGAGDWTLQILDEFTLDGGAIGDWSIEYTGLPAPAVLALFGMAGLASRRRRG